MCVCVVRCALCVVCIVYEVTLHTAEVSVLCVNISEKKCKAGSFFKDRQPSKKADTGRKNRETHYFCLSMSGSPLGCTDPSFSGVRMLFTRFTRLCSMACLIPFNYQLINRPFQKPICICFICFFCNFHHCFCPTCHLVCDVNVHVIINILILK